MLEEARGEALRRERGRERGKKRKRRGAKRHRREIDGRWHAKKFGR